MRITVAADTRLTLNYFCSGISSNAGIEKQRETLGEVSDLKEKGER
jgi:hypothetical protein